MNTFSVDSFDLSIFENESRRAYFQVSIFHKGQIFFVLRHLLSV